MKLEKRQLDFRKDDTNSLARKFYSQNYSLYKDEIYDLLMYRIEQKNTLERYKNNMSSELLKFVRREKLKQIEKNTK